MPDNGGAVPIGRTKKLTGALLQIARQGSTTHPLLARVFLAQKINRVCATTIGPWDVDGLPDTFIDAIKALDTDLAEMKRGFEQVAAAQARIRARYKNP
jgi:hypothetical protein